MSSEFIALPLTSGESFLLKTRHNGREWNILVDSGKKYAGKLHPLVKEIKQHVPDLEKIDIAICTHQDADHANGFKNFADAWSEYGGSITEYWLPGRWAVSMPLLLVNPEEFLLRVLKGAIFANDILRNVSSPNVEERTILMSAERMRVAAKENSINSKLKEALLTPDELDNSKERDSGNGESTGSGLAKSLGLNERELQLLRKDIEETDRTIDPLDVTIKPLIWLNFFNHLQFIGGDTGFLEALDTAKSIRNIACSAVKHSITIRWFDFGLFEDEEKPAGGISGLLEPVCSVEVIPNPPNAIKIDGLALFFSLMLTRQNVESLVFYRPETGDEPGVLFLGDSRLAFGINNPKQNFPLEFPKPKRAIVVTSPHHGSCVNDRAYSVIKEWIDRKENGLFYIRNGGQTGQKLGKYLSQEKRRCAQCVQCKGKNWRQLVRISAQEKLWNWPPHCITPCGTPRS